jgi:hypothetical protein
MEPVSPFPELQVWERSKQTGTCSYMKRFACYPRYRLLLNDYDYGPLLLEKTNYPISSYMSSAGSKTDITFAWYGQLQNDFRIPDLHDRSRFCTSCSGSLETTRLVGQFWGLDSDRVFVFFLRQVVFSQKVDVLPGGRPMGHGL